MNIMKIRWAQTIVSAKITFEVSSKVVMWLCDTSSSLRSSKPTRSSEAICWRRLLLKFNRSRPRRPIKEPAKLTM